MTIWIAAKRTSETKIGISKPVKTIWDRYACNYLFRFLFLAATFSVIFFLILAQLYINTVSR